MRNSVSTFPDLHIYEEVAQSLYEDICNHGPLAAQLDDLGVEGGFVCVANQFGEVIAHVRFGEEPVIGDPDGALLAAVAAATGLSVGSLSSRASMLVGVRYEPGALRGFHHILSCRFSGFDYDSLTPKDRQILTDLSELFVIAFSLKLNRDCQIKEMVRDMAVGILFRYCSPHAELFDPFLQGTRRVLA
ncbi:MAG TPA: hypothetical protein VEA92_03875 [Candidatus Paceibacterota bacterium]|nr:hypothetical protein [Candidatus Paceibacterota bacterium]